VSQNQTTAQSHPRTNSRVNPVQTRFAHSYYAILGLHPSASVIEIRQAYRELSKRYHPDTTELSAEVATAQFRRLNEAYGILSNPERRSLYDLKIGYSRWYVLQDPHQNAATSASSNASLAQGSKLAYLDASDRPLSAGEIFALLTMGITFLGCLILVVCIAILRGDSLIPPTALPQENLPRPNISDSFPVPSSFNSQFVALSSTSSIHPTIVYAPSFR
jgi:curved DNA-binding protein CbpA